MGGGRATAAVIVVALLAADARADESGVRLVVERTSGAESCAGTEDLRQRVVARLQHDPFALDGARTLLCTIERDGDHWLASVRLVEPDGTVAGARSVSSSAETCDVLSERLVLVLAVALTNLGTSRSQPAVVSTPPAPPAPAADDAPAPPATSADLARPSATTGIDAYAGLAGYGDETGALGPAAVIGLGVSHTWLQLAVEASIPSGSTIELEADGGVAVHRVRLSLVPCARASSFSGCAVVSSGWTTGRGEDLMDASSATTPILDLGVRGGWQHAITRSFAVRLHAGAELAVSRTTFRVDDVAVWQTPRLSFYGAISMIRSWR